MISIFLKEQEENNIKFYNHFKKYVTTKDIQDLKELKYLKISKILIDYLTYYENNTPENYQIFISNFAEKYINMNLKEYKSNQLYYFHEIIEGQSFEQLKRI